MARLRATGAVARLLRRAPDPLPGARIVVGLGNHGADYARHRHNVGARAVERLAHTLDLPRARRARLVLTIQGETPYGPLVLARPRLFMNQSGRAVQALLTAHRSTPERLILIVDELDLPPGRVRVRAGGGDAGHRGMRSIKQILGTLEFPRVRIGVGRPQIDGRPSRDPDAVAAYLLSDPAPDEAGLLAAGEERAGEAVLAILTIGVEDAMNRFNAVSTASPSLDPREP